MLIPEANDIRPCERPKDYVTNQLAYYPTKLKYRTNNLENFQNGLTMLHFIPTNTSKISNKKI
jgi:hypothetical protein